MAAAEQYLKILIYGPSGRGKTYFLGTALEVPELLPCLLIDTEGGLRTIRSAVRRISLKDIGKDVNPNQFDTITPNTWNEFHSIHQALRKSLAGPNPPYKTVMIDSLSEMNFTNLMEAVRFGIESDRRGSHDPILPDQRDYGRSNMQMRITLRSFVDLPCNLICTASSDEKVNADGTTSIELDFAGQLTDRIPRLFDIVGFLSLRTDPKGSWRVLSVGPRKNTFTKYRGEKGMPSDIEHPTMKSLIEKIEEIEGSPILSKLESIESTN